jgi:hypothetical protein
MGSKYEQHILDGWLNPKIVTNFDEVEKYRTMGDNLYVNKDLADFGKSEQKKITGGQYGSTMLAKAAKAQGANDIAGLKSSQRLGAAALNRSSGNANASLMYDRMLGNSINEINDRTAMQSVQSLPGYVNQTADWADAENKGLREKLGFGQAYQGMFANAVNQRMSNQTFEKKKSLWDKIKEGVGFAGNLVGIASGIGAPFSMNSGGGAAASGGSKVGAASRSGGYGQYY